MAKGEVLSQGLHPPVRAPDSLGKRRSAVRYEKFPHSLLMATTTGSKQTPDSTAQDQQRTSEPSQIPTSSVLVVENHEDTRFLFRTLLEFRGAKVVEAENGEMAIALAANVHLDLILMDASLPLLDGFEATRRIRELSSMSDVPIVFISGHALATSQAKAFAAGCTDYLVKPIDFLAWDSVLERYLPLVKGSS